jgi:hypothetical protein
MIRGFALSLGYGSLAHVVASGDANPFNPA